MITEVFAIDPDIGIHIHPAEKDLDDFSFISFFQGEMFAIPSRTTHYISGSSLSGTFV
jgi:hypothetical protein